MFSYHLSVKDTWEHLKRIVHEIAKKQVGVTKPNRSKIDKQTWLWTREVEAQVHEKKRLYHAFLKCKGKDWMKYAKAKGNTKLIAAAKSAHYDEIMPKLKGRNGENFVYHF